MLPVLSTGSEAAKGFRPNEQGYWQRDRTEVLVDDLPLDWLASENWSERELSRRGRLPDDVTQRKILVLGGGAIGSAMAELLVRGGVHDLAIMDRDMLQAGNLVRHTLGLGDVGGLKGESLAGRLNLCSPHALISGYDDNFPPKEGALRRRGHSLHRCSKARSCWTAQGTTRSFAAWSSSNGLSRGSFSLFG